MRVPGLCLTAAIIGAAWLVERRAGLRGSRVLPKDRQPNYAVAAKLPAKVSMRRRLGYLSWMAARPLR
jgi:hypothetical protein